MENLSELNQSPAPDRNTSSLISHALDLFKGVIGHILLAMLVYIAASFVINMIFGVDQQTVVEEIQSAGEGFSAQDLFEIEGMKTYYTLSGVLSWLLAPLFVGIIYVTSKHDSRNPITFNDLFIAYRQNFLNILLYSIISTIILGIAFMLCFLPGLFVAPLFLLGYPILLFENANAMEAIKKSYAIAKANYGTFLGTTLLGGLISIAGILFCGIGIIVTAPFIYVVMYSVYCAYVGKPRQLLGDPA